MNIVILSGRLVYEPECKTTSDGKVYLSTRLAVSRNDKAKTTDFFSIRAWESNARFIQSYFHKGDPIEIIGKLQTSSYEKQDGTKAVDTYVLIERVEFTLQKRTEAVTGQGELPAEPTKLPFEL